MTQPSRIGALRSRVEEHLRLLYPHADVPQLASDLIADAELEDGGAPADSRRNNWSETDVVAIAYGDSIVRPGERPLATLGRFLAERLDGVINGVHILPFFPYSSDDGFSVIDYDAVNPKLGDWDDVRRIAARFRLMADLVINHCSSQSVWFQNFKAGRHPGTDYFVAIDPTTDLSAVVRPRATPLLTEVETAAGPRWVWCTFSADQVDLNFQNPEVLREIVRLMRRYMERGVKLFRLDAIAFLWKQPGTPSIHLPQTHELIRLLRLLIERRDPEAIVITETNVPNRENLTYFGNANEAHAIYNFSLPPLLTHAMISGKSRHLKTWMMSMPPPQFGTAYLNFIASHDGIGLRPAEGLLSPKELENLLNTMRRAGGRINMRKGPAGTQKPYEINISLWDALQGTVTGSSRDEWQMARFLCAHAIMIGLEGIPAIYIHSLLATGNDYEKVVRTGENRAINRRNWDYDELSRLLDDPHSHHARVLSEMSRLLRIRRAQPAFHPNATQFTLHLGDQVFGFWRQSMYRDQSIFAIHNVAALPREVPLRELNLIGTDRWGDLISGREYTNLHGKILLEPYQFVWLTNRL